MIISHKYKFILFRPQKVAGTSIQLAMGIQCGESDIVPLLRPKDKYDKDCESFFERYKERNYSHEIKNAHLGPKSVLKNFGKYIFSKYY